MHRWIEADSRYTAQPHLPFVFLAFYPSIHLPIYQSKVYKEYVSIFRGGTGSGSGRRSPYRFDALVFDQVMRYRVSCRHWVCPACAAK